MESLPSWNSDLECFFRLFTDCLFTDHGCLHPRADGAGKRKKKREREGKTNAAPYHAELGNAGGGRSERQ